MIQWFPNSFNVLFLNLSSVSYQEGMDRLTMEIEGRLRIACVCDIHLQPERDAFHLAESFCEHLLSPENRPDLILLGGDVVMNVVAADEQRAHLLWGLWVSLREKLDGIPIVPCIGNQDIWGWSSASGCTGSEPLFGKRMAQKYLGMERRYGTHHAGGWKIIVLDSVQRGGKLGFTPELDAEQMDWFANELSCEEDLPTLILSHVPILPGPIDFLALNQTRPGSHGWTLNGTQAHNDGYRILEMIRERDNVKLCVNGHVHAPQTIEMLGKTFITSPAVCGAWWRGQFLGSPSGHLQIDLMKDGTFLASNINWEYAPSESTKKNNEPHTFIPS